MNTLEHLLSSQNTLGEGAVWSVQEQAFYWIDIENGSFSRLDPATGQYESFDVGMPIGVLALRAAGGMVMAVKNGFAFWDAQKQQLQPIVNPEANRPHLRFNDGAVDCRGSFWAGSMGGPREGTLYRLDPDRSVHAMMTEVSTPNGIGWSPDNTIMYFTDSPLHMIYAFDFDAETGAISNRRTFAHTPEEVGEPDGLTVDSEGYVWSAYWDAAKIVRRAPSGTIERVIPIPALRPTSCVFGGPDLTELYITSASTGLSAEQQRQYPLSGDLFRLKTAIKGQVKYLYGG